MKDPVVSDARLRQAYERLVMETAAGGYNLNPDREFVRELLSGILVNEQRHGYGACPCRLPSGKEEKDRDIVCPCDYRDRDLSDFGQCYCGLYVSEEVVRKKKGVGSIPERRPVGGGKQEASPPGPLPTGLPYPVWRCPVCGYLCAREGPPLACPICKAKKDRFERFL
jgi:ferredoxin-thioredoxin reductase catalytic subunit